MNKSLKKTIGTAIATLALTAAPVAAEPFAPAPDAEAQLDVMAASGIIEAELKACERTEKALRRKGQAERTSYIFYDPRNNQGHRHHGHKGDNRHHNPA